jgi:hypothetical protein
VEAFFIPKAQKSTTGAEQSQGAADCFLYRGIMHHSYAPEGQTISKEYYLEVIRHLCDKSLAQETGPVALTQLVIAS